MLHVHATPRAFVFIGRLAELTALAAASPPQAPLFPAPRDRPPDANTDTDADAGRGIVPA